MLLHCGLHGPIVFPGYFHVCKVFKGTILINREGIHNAIASAWRMPLESNFDVVNSTQVVIPSQLECGGDL